MANLYKCDVCGEIQEGNTRLQLGVIQPGKTYKDRRNVDVCPPCYSRAEVKAFMKFIKLVESPAE